MTIGILDSGRGGLSIVKELIGKGHRCYYFADLKYAPYGTKNGPFINMRIKKIIKFLKKRGCEEIIIACNSASIAYDGSCIKITDANIAIASQIDNPIVLATEFTIKSQFYQNAIKQGEFIACQKLVKAIEDENELLIEQQLHDLSLKIKPRSNIVLACTHFSLIKDKIGSYLKCFVHDGNNLLIKSIAPGSSEQYLFFHSGSDELFICFIKKYLLLNNFYVFSHYLDD